MSVTLRPRKRRGMFSLGLLLGVALMLGWQYWRAARLDSTAGMPKDEAKIVGILMSARAAWSQAPNDLARVGMREARADALCKAEPALAFTDWLGRVVSIAPDGFPDYFGKPTARIVIGLTSAVSVSTPAAPLLNNPATMVEAGSPIYAIAATLRPGARVRFSGNFFTGSDCWDELSLTRDGAMTAPIFKVQLTALRAD